MDLMKREMDVQVESNEPVTFKPSELAELQLALVGGGIGDAQV